MSKRLKTICEKLHLALLFHTVKAKLKKLSHKNNLSQKEKIQKHTARPFPPKATPIPLHP